MSCLEPKDTVTSPWKSMASTTASATSWMDSSSSSPTVGTEEPTARSGLLCLDPLPPSPTDVPAALLSGSQDRRVSCPMQWGWGCRAPT